jgi:glycine C-acetyltransferase
MERLYNRLAGSLQKQEQEGLRKLERIITSAQGNEIKVEGLEKPVLNFCSNDYLGLSNHPKVLSAAKRALDTYGYGLSSVRFICGTQRIHRDLEERLSDWLGLEDTIIYTSCFNANGGLFESVLGEKDTLISARLNHASIIDGARLTKCRRLIYKEDDPADLAGVLMKATAPDTDTIVVTDGVFSMEGTLAPLDNLLPICKRYGALLAVDDSHAVGLVGSGGRGTPERFGVAVDILTGTLGKALGGACGGYISGKRELIEWLRNTSRPYLFSNSLAPSLVAGGLAAIDIAASDEGMELRERLNDNTIRFRQSMREAGFNIPDGEHPIIPVILDDALIAGKMAERLLQLGIYVISFSYPVVPRESPRIRVQISAAHTPEQIDRAIEAFAAIGGELGIVNRGASFNAAPVFPTETATMQAWVYRTEQQPNGTHLRLEQVPTPAPHPGELLLKISRLTVCGTDEDLFHGKFSDVHDGIIPGHEIFGEIVDLGSNVRGFEIGQKIVVESHYLIPGYVEEGIIGLWGPRLPRGGYLLPLNGGYAEYTAIPSYCAHVVPETLDNPDFFPSLLEGAGNDCLIAKYLLDRNLLGSVAVLGCGPHGLFTQMFCKYFGAAKVAAFEVNSSRAEFAAGFGADRIINPLASDFEEQVKDFTAGKGFDVVIDTAGTRREVLETCLGLVRDGGTLVLFGLYGDESILLNGHTVNDIIFNQRDLNVEYAGKRIHARGITGREGIWPYLIDTVALSKDLQQKIMKPVTVMGPLDNLGADTAAYDREKIMKRAYTAFSR